MKCGLGDCEPLPPPPLPLELALAFAAPATRYPPERGREYCGAEKPDPLFMRYGLLGPRTGADSPPEKALVLSSRAVKGERGGRLPAGELGKPPRLSLLARVMGLCMPRR